MTRYFAIWMIWLMQAMLSPCLAQEQTDVMPDFKHCFDVWLKNRTTYNQYNDSVFLIKDYKEWVPFFNRRSVKVHQLYEEDKKIMQGYAQYYESPEFQVSTQAYLGLRDEFYRDITSGQIDDPFILLEVCGILEKEGEQVPDSLKSTNLINALRLFGYVQLWNMGGDEEYMRKAYECGKQLLSDEAKKYPYYLYSYSSAMSFMTRTWWMINKLQTISEYRDCIRLLAEFLARPDIDKLIRPVLKRQLQHILDTADESLVRNTYLVDSETMSKQEADSIMRQVVKRNLANPHLTALSYLRTLYMQMNLGDITGREAWKKAMERYEQNWAEMKDKHMDVYELDEYLQPFYTFFYINYKSGMPVDVKRQTVLRMSYDIETAFRNRKDMRRNTAYIRDMIRLSTYDKVTMYLTPEEVERFLCALNMATQPASYVHSVNTAKITDELMAAILKHQPQLLVGTLGCESVQDVKKNKKALTNFAHQAALYHDIGKNSIASLINKGHRPLMREERQLMQKHCEFGLKYLEQTPTLAQYSDIAMGHHKWYNGKGGYPEKFDNTKSSLRFMIDVVAIADNIQDAAEACVRYDGYPNPLKAKMEDLRQGSGTRFNPDLVSLIDAHPDLLQKIAWLIDEGWVKTSYDISKTYLEAFKK